MNKIQRIGATMLLAGWIAAWHPSVAGDQAPTAGRLIFFPGDGLAPLGETEGGALSVPIGWNMPGKHYQSGDGWWMLNCINSCVLEPTRLTVREGTHPDYDGPPLPSQLLSWSRPGGGNIGREAPPVILLKSAAPAPVRLSGGSVTTWLHAGMGSYPDGERPGRMESVIDLGAHGRASVVPRIVQSPDGTAPESHNHDASEPELIFELRAYGKRQRLGTYSWDIEGARPLSGPEYLRWAGDLDRDGKLDLLMSYASRGWNTVLYLSSLAGEGEIVGEAGRFTFWPPNDPGC
jgi:hypothetical protein